MSRLQMVQTPVNAVAGGLRVIANLIALVWLGMGMGLTSKNTNLAAPKAIVFVQIIPWLVASFALVLRCAGIRPA